MTIFKKSLLTLSLAALCFSTVLVIFSMVFMNSLYYEVNTLGLKNTAKTLITAIGEDRIIDVFLNPAGGSVNLPVSADDAYRITLVDTAGYVLWDSHFTAGIVNHIDREEIIAALEGREASARRSSITSGGMKLIYYAQPVFHNGVTIGVFRISFYVPGFLTRVSPVIIPFVIFSVLLAIAAFWIIYIYSRSLAGSLGRLVNIAQLGMPLLSGPEAEEPVAQEFKSLEKTLRAMTLELNSRIEQAKAEGRRLEAILNGMSEALFAMDSFLRLHLINPRAREIFNLGNRDIASKGSVTLLEATRSTELVMAAKKALTSNTPLEMELTLHSEAEKHFQVYVSPLQAPGSQPNDLNARETSLQDAGGVVIVMQEITRLVRLERIRKDFVANVSHELRTPIQLIKGFSETLLDTVSGMGDNNEKKQITHFTEIISKNAAIMENLTNDLLILADLENNTVNARDMEELDVYLLVDEAVSSMQQIAINKQIEITVNCPEGLVAKLYGSLIIQALINLIDNSIKYSPAKSKIKVSAYLSDGETGDQKELILEVRDKGIGIPTEHLERIFERFYRVDKARSREAESGALSRPYAEGRLAGGTGLGLSIVRHIALLHNGKAEVESRAGEGSVFRIKLPQSSNQS